MSGQSTNRSKKFVKDIGIYAIGNLGSKLVTFMMVPLYTFFVTDTKAFGYYDLCQTFIFLLMAFVTVQLRDGGFRFLIDADSDTQRKSIVTFIYKTLITNSIFAIILSVGAWFLFDIKYLSYIIGLLIAMSFYEVTIQVVRGLGRTKMFVETGIITSLLIAIFSVIFVMVLHMEVKGIFISNILARVFSLGILELRLHIFRKFFNYKFDDPHINKEILKYSLPLLASGVCWWVITGSNRFFIEKFIGLNDNGLFAVAQKFASILETLAFIFFQAWQENALQQYHSKDRDKFFSSIFNNYSYVLTALVIVTCILLKINYFWLVDSNYYSSWTYVYPLCVATMLYSLTVFFDMGYQCSKHTVGIMTGVIGASILILFSNYFLVQQYHIYGIIASSIITYIGLLIYRIIDTHKYFKIQFTTKTVLVFLLIPINGFLFYAINSTVYLLIYLVIITAIFIIFMPQEMKTMIISKLPIKRH